jgi:hypothetical protein
MERIFAQRGPELESVTHATERFGCEWQQVKWEWFAGRDE